MPDAERSHHRKTSPGRRSAALVAAVLLLFAAARAGLFAPAAGLEPHAGCGCKPGASCCLLLAKLGKKCCSMKHGGAQAGGKPSCSVAPSERQDPATPALRELTAPKAVAAVPAAFPAPRFGRPVRPAGGPAASVAGREPPDPPPRIC